MSSIEFSLSSNKKRESIESIEDITQKSIQEAESVQILPENRNAEGKLLTDNGKVSNLQNELYWKMVRTPSFKKWFGESKIVDSNGEPLLVYHGSGNFKGDHFDPTKTSSMNKLGRGAYFTPYINYAVQAGSVLSDNGGLHFCFLNVKDVQIRYDAEMQDAGRAKTMEKNTFLKTLQQKVASSLDKNIGKAVLIKPDSYSKIMEFKGYTPEEIATEKQLAETYSEAERYGEIAVNNKENIMILPMPLLKSKKEMAEVTNTTKLKEVRRPGHDYLLKDVDSPTV